MLIPVVFQIKKNNSHVPISSLFQVDTELLSLKRIIRPTFYIISPKIPLTYQCHVTYTQFAKV